MKINLFVQTFYLLKTSGRAGQLFLCLLMRSSLFLHIDQISRKRRKEGVVNLLVALASYRFFLPFRLPFRESEYSFFSLDLSFLLD